MNSHSSNDIEQGLISVTSPIARALIGKEEGDSAQEDGKKAITDIADLLDGKRLDRNDWKNIRTVFYNKRFRKRVRFRFNDFRGNCQKL